MLLCRFVIFMYRFGVLRGHILNISADFVYFCGFAWQNQTQTLLWVCFAFAHSFCMFADKHGRVQHHGCEHFVHRSCSISSNGRFSNVPIYHRHSWRRGVWQPTCATQRLVRRGHLNDFECYDARTRYNQYHADATMRTTDARQAGSIRLYGQLVRAMIPVWTTFTIFSRTTT